MRGVVERLHKAVTVSLLTKTDRIKKYLLHHGHAHLDSDGVSR